LEKVNIKESIAIVNIGNELLLGRTINTNLSWLGNELASMGLEVSKALIIPDDSDSIKEVLEHLIPSYSLIIFTGGLGPTKDDISKKVIAEFFGKELIFDEKIWLKIQDMFAFRKVPVPEINKNQALVPKDFTILQNDMGTAPGLFYHEKNMMLFAMPGVPIEMKHLFTERIKPILAKACSNKEWFLQTINTYGISESAIAELMEVLTIPDNVHIAWLPQTGRVDIRVYGSEKKACQKAYDEIKALLKPYIWGENYANVAQKLHELLITKQKTIACAESCTGGMIQKLLTDMPGSSAYLQGGIISYSNEIKERLLYVPHEIIEQDGAVSESCARAMMDGLKKSFNSDFRVSVTGIAGPDGGSDLPDEKPVGLVYIGIAYAEIAEIFKMRFLGNRDSIRFKTAEFVFYQMIKCLEN